MSGIFRTALPNAGGYSATTNMDNVRSSLQMLRFACMLQVDVPGFDADYAYDGASRLSVLTMIEQTAHAAADTPVRASTARIRARVTYIYDGAGALTKKQFEISGDNGATWTAWLDLAGRSFLNYGYTSGRLVSKFWSVT